MNRSRQSRRRRWLATRLALAFGVAIIAPAPVSVAAEPGDGVLTWHRHAVAALSNAPGAATPGAGQLPPVSTMHLAMVQLAVYDAVNAIEGGRVPYVAGMPPAEGASIPAAVATAAHDVLVGLTPALPQAVRDNVGALRVAALGAIDDGPAKTAGIAIGSSAASRLLADRVGDGRYVPYGFAIGSVAGAWRPTPPGFGTDQFAWAARVRPFALLRPDQYETAGPLALDSVEYAEELNEVKRMGSAEPSGRTPDQTELARFMTANPVPMLNTAIRDVAAAQDLSAADSARLLAMTTTAAADALINCWAEKDRWGFWRPITAIHEADLDGNPLTEADDDWRPLVNTPPYPDHPSGYNCFTAGTMHAAKAFFGTDQMEFSITSPLVTEPRDYERFTDVIDDTIDGRIWNGFHFRTADVQGAWIGKKVAQWVARHEFLALD